MADQNPAQQRALAEGRELTERSRREASERLKGKPTPTQEENDRFAVGEHIMEHEDDGSGPELVVTRQVEPRKPSTSAGYSTRAAAPAKPKE